MGDAVFGFIPTILPEPRFRCQLTDCCHFDDDWIKKGEA